MPPVADRPPKLPMMQFLVVGVPSGLLNCGNLSLQGGMRPMVSSVRQPLNAAKPKVLVLGDAIVDQHIYDMRAEDADQSLAWTSPLSRDDWHYAAGFETRQCL